MRFVPLFLAVPLLLAGCAHTPREPLAVPLPEGAPAVGDILADLAAQQDRFDRFQVAGSLVAKLPGDAAAYVLRNTRLACVAPDRVHVDARKHGARAFLLTASSDGYVVLSPAKKTYAFGTEGLVLEGASGRFTPALLARELLLGRDWAAVAARTAVLTSFDPATGEAALTLHDTPRRRAVTGRLIVAGGPPWRVLLDRRLDPATGQVLAETNREGYADWDGVPFPGRVETRLPGRDAWMRLDVRNLDLDPELDPVDFDVEAALADARRRGYERVEVME